MDEETKAFLVAMEARLMARMNNQHAAVMASLTTLLIAMRFNRPSSPEDRLDDLERGSGP